jgi:amino acid adenylation domain-containing protein
MQSSMAAEGALRIAEASQDGFTAGPGSAACVLPERLLTAPDLRGSSSAAVLASLCAAASAVFHRYTGASQVRLRICGSDTEQGVELETDISDDPTWIAVRDAVQARIEAAGPVSRARQGILIELAGDGWTADSLNLRVERGTAEYRVTASGAAGILDAEGLAGWLAALRWLLEAACAAPDTPVARLPLLSPEDRDARIASGMGARRPYPRDATVPDLFAAQVRLRPDAVAIREGTRTWTYRELDAEADALARCLIGLGAKPGAHIGLLLDRSGSAIVAHLAALKAGAAYVPLDPAHPDELLALQIADSDPAVVVSRRGLAAGRAHGGLWTCPTLWLDDPAPRPASREALPGPGAAEDLAYVMYTSGTTGRPKGVMVPHRGIARLVINTDFAALGPDEIVLQLAPLAFDAATLEIWGPLLNGGQLVVMPAGPTTVDAIARAVGDHGVTTLWLTAGLFHLMADGPLGDLASLRQLLAGGDVLSPRHVRQTLDALPHCRLINGYGPTENTTFTCCYTVPRGFPPAETVPIGRPIANTCAHILDRRLEPLPRGAVGQLCAGGDGLARGYLGRPDLTAERFVSDPFSREPGARLYLTGDLVRERPDGTLAFLGRVDGQVKINGHRIELEGLDAALRRLPGVRDAAAVVQADTGGGKSLVAYVVLESPETAPERLRTALAQRVPAAMIPSAVIALPTLPLGPNGKVDRRALQQPARTRPNLGRPYVPPRGPDEERVAREWRRVLGIDAVGVEDNFFDLGGTSLQLMAIHQALRGVLAPDLTIIDLFARPTIRSLVASPRAPDSEDGPNARARATRQSDALRRFRQHARS